MRIGYRYRGTGRYPSLKWELNTHFKFVTERDCDKLTAQQSVCALLRWTQNWQNKSALLYSVALNGDSLIEGGQVRNCMQTVTILALSREFYLWSLWMAGGFSVMVASPNRGADTQVRPRTECPLVLAKTEVGGQIFVKLRSIKFRSADLDLFHAYRPTDKRTKWFDRAAQAASTYRK
jgi:hypothetical protein